jgi:hypothetical protein
MSKESAGWLALRVIGLLLLGVTLCLLFQTAVNCVVAAKLGGIGGDMASRAEPLALRGWIDTGISLVKTAIASGLCFYFLRRGKTLHKLLMWESK